MTRDTARFPSAMYRAGAIVVGFSESASPIETTMPMRRSMGALFPPLVPSCGAPQVRGRGSREVELVGLVVGGRTLARRAPPARLHRRAADRVPGGLGPFRVACAPTRQQAQGAGQLAARGAELVHEARRSPGGGAGGDERRAVEGAHGAGRGTA